MLRSSVDQRVELEKRHGCHNGRDMEGTLRRHTRLDSPATKPHSQGTRCFYLQVCRDLIAPLSAYRRSNWTTRLLNALRVSMLEGHDVSIRYRS